MALRLYVRVRSASAILRGWIAGERGAVATEYGLVLVLVALAIIVAITGVGLAVARLYSSGSSALP